MKLNRKKIGIISLVLAIVYPFMFLFSVYAKEQINTMSTSSMWQYGVGIWIFSLGVYVLYLAIKNIKE